MGLKDLSSSLLLFSTNTADLDNNFSSSVSLLPYNCSFDKGSEPKIKDWHRRDVAFRMHKKLQKSKEFRACHIK